MYKLYRQFLKGRSRLTVTFTLNDSVSSINSLLDYDILYLLDSVYTRIIFFEFRKTNRKRRLTLCHHLLFTSVKFRLRAALVLRER